MLFQKKETSETPAELAGLDAASNGGAPIADAPTATATPEQKNLVADFKSLPVPDKALDLNVISYLNSAISLAVAEAVRGLAPALAEIGRASKLSREDLMVLSGRDPEAEAKFKARLLRERKQWKEQEDEKITNLAKLQAACTHRDDGQKPAFYVTHNYPDRQVRFMCGHCFLQVEPRHFVIDAPNSVTGESQHHLEPAHPLYEEWFKIANQQGKV